VWAVPARVIVTTRLAAGPAPGPSGPALHAALLAAIRRRDATLAADLHDRRPPKPFALSPLSPDGDALRFEVGVLDDPLAEPIALALDETDLTVLRSTLAIERIDVYPAHYEDLLAAAPATRWRLALHSPTTLRLPASRGESRRTLPFPEPVGVLERLRARFEAFAPAGLLAPGLDRGIAAVVVTAFDLRTARALVRPPDRHEVGALGRITYELPHPGGFDEHTRRSLHALFLLAAYAGLGDQTTKGLGWVRLVDA
jgi:CRISPR-associated endoribonuclease Cas6